MLRYVPYFSSLFMQLLALPPSGLNHTYPHPDSPLCDAGAARQCNLLDDTNDNVTHKALVYNLSQRTAAHVKKCQGIHKKSSSFA